MYQLSEEVRKNLFDRGVVDLTERFSAQGFVLKGSFVHRGPFGWQTVAVVGLDDCEQGFVAGGGMKLKPFKDPFSDETLTDLMLANVEAAGTMAEKFSVAGPFFESGAPICGTKFLGAVPNTLPGTIEETIRDIVRTFGPLLMNCLGTGGDENAPFSLVRKVMMSLGYAHPQQGIIAGLGLPVRETCELLDRVCQHPVEVPLIGEVRLIDTAAGFTTFVALKTAAGGEINGLRLAVQGTGALGLLLIGFLSEEEPIIVGVSSINGMVANDRGLDVAEIMAAVDRKPPRGWKESLEGFRWFDVPLGVAENLTALISGRNLDAILPCATAHAVTGQNVESVLSALSGGKKLLISGADDGVTSEAVGKLVENGVVVPPDFVVNAGVAAVFGMVEDGRVNDPDQDVLAMLRENTEEFIRKPPKWRI